MNPRLFRFEDNIGAILTSFPRVIRRAAGMMNQYSQAVGDKVISLIRRAENEISAHEIACLANERSRQVSEPAAEGLKETGGCAVPAKVRSQRRWHPSVGEFWGGGGAGTAGVARWTPSCSPSEI